LVSGGVELTTGASGTTSPEGAEAGDEPPAERATTLTVYVVPASPPSTQLESPGPVLHDDGPGDAVARYPVIATPLELGGDHDTLIDE
jgi:hypothetical protein